MAANKARPISAEFPYQSHYLIVNGSRMRYIMLGQGDPILFVHGNPTSSYLWRNVIPHLSRYGRCIAIDLIGMGESDKPIIDYTFFDHSEYLESFIEKLGLKNITLVLHDWGGPLGFYYTARHQDNVKGIAFMETFVAPIKWAYLPEQVKYAYKLFRTKFLGWLMIGYNNYFIEKVMPLATLRQLTDKEMAYYRAPFKTIESRIPIWSWPNQLPIEGVPKDTYDVVQLSLEMLKHSNIPKLVLFAKPGAVMPEKFFAKWLQDTLPNLEEVNVGKGLHYIQEDCPHEIGEAIAKWMRTSGQC